MNEEELKREIRALKKEVKELKATVNFLKGFCEGINHSKEY